jgi:outer membrane protein assembly factor BamB
MVLKLIETRFNYSARIGLTIVIFVRRCVLVSAANEECKAWEHLQGTMHGHRQPQHCQHQRHQGLCASHTHILTIGRTDFNWKPVRHLGYNHLTMKTGLLQWVRFSAFCLLLQGVHVHPDHFVAPQIEWQIPERLSGGPTLGTNGLVYGAVQERVYAWDGVTGQSRWMTSLPLSSYLGAGLVVGPEANVYVSTSSRVFALDGHTGAILWAADGREPISVGPDGTVFLFGDGVRALDPATGTTRWSGLQYGGGEKVPAAVGANGLLFVAGGPFIWALHTATGDHAWLHVEEALRFTSLALTGDGTLLVASSSGDILAIESGSGHLLWRAQGSGIISDVIIGPEGLVYAAHDGVVYFRDARTGESQRRLVLPYAQDLSLAFTADGTLHLAAYNIAENRGQLLALNPASGETNWVFEAADTYFFADSRHQPAFGRPLAQSAPESTKYRILAEVRSA